MTNKRLVALSPIRWLHWSLSGQLVVATLLAVLPLVVAVSFAALSLDKQVREQHQLVVSMATLNHLAVSVSQQVKELERTARQYRLLREPRFLELYATHLEGLARNHETLNAMPALDGEPELLGRILDLMETLQTELEPASFEDGNLEDLLPLLQQAYDLSDEFDKQIEEHLGASLAAGEEQFDTTLRHLFIIGALAIPGTMLLVIIATLAIAAPVRRLARAIREIGHHRWQEPIAIRGPTELLELGERLDWMRRKLVVSENRSHALSQHITHELKGPLAAITEAGSLLAEGVPGDLTPAQQRVIDILRNNAAHLHELILQLISYGAANQRDGADAEQPVDLQELCSAQRAQLEGTADDHQIRWRFPDAPLTVTADPLALQMVVNNLLSNAFHYSPRAGEIRVEWEQDESDWRLSVSDDGPGIPKAEQQDIFNLFFRGADNGRRTVKGSGIGLAIVEECVKGMNGSIRVISGVGRGSTFRVECPRTGTEVQ